jgi:hypothetical protein
MSESGAGYLYQPASTMESRVSYEFRVLEIHQRQLASATFNTTLLAARTS